jgi:hypothetical protein
MWPKENVAELNAFYGNPTGTNGEAAPAWQAKNLVAWVPPYPMFYSDAHKSPLHSLRVHQKCHEAFDAAFLEVLKTLGYEYIKAHRLDISGGTFCYRVQRGGSRLSVHSWGCAIDMDPAHNPFPKHWEAGVGMLDKAFVAVLVKHGFDWRGKQGDNDSMHLQLCRH